ncbi:MAG: isopenicillin N synthase family oxygenase [Caulobacterales bacterium]|nr:isopenicillin N synthase family oxygenase [Caulobacterales bacterium]
MTRAVPELSLAEFNEGSASARAAFSAELMRGLQDYGFVVLRDHGVPASLLEAAYASSEAVFALPAATKRTYAAGMRGYTPFGVEHAKDSGQPDLKEFWQVGHDSGADPTGTEGFEDNVWPSEVPEFQTTISALFDRLNNTGMVVLQALAPELGLTTHWFDDKVRWGTSLLRILHYPPVSSDTPDGAVRSAAHEDINFLTLMPAARGAGLELLDRDGSWLPIQADSSTLIVDSGDMMARLTNGVIPATTHRVVNPSGPNVSRYSIPFFMHPTLATSLDVLPSCRSHAPVPSPITAGELLDERLRAIGLRK